MKIINKCKSKNEKQKSEISLKLKVKVKVKLNVMISLGQWKLYFTKQSADSSVDNGTGQTSAGLQKWNLF